jgi:hypothetical protein
MKPEKGKYYRFQGVSQYAKIYHVSGSVQTFKEIYMSENRTRIEVRTLQFFMAEPIEITKAQFDRIERLANARIKQYEYYV